MIDKTKDNFTQTLSVKEIVEELEISKDDYYRTLSISKDEDLELHLKKEPNSCFINNYFDVSLKTIVKAYFSNRECSVPEVVYHILPVLKLTRIIPAVYFVNTNPPEERVQVLLSEKELSELPDNSPKRF